MLEMMEEMFPPEVHWTRPQAACSCGVFYGRAGRREVLKVRSSARWLSFRRIVPSEWRRQEYHAAQFLYSNPETIREGITRMERY